MTTTAPERPGQPDQPEHPAFAAEVERLRAALLERDRQQAATAEVLRIIARAASDGGAADLDRVMLAIIEAACRLCPGAEGSIWRTDGDSQREVANNRHASGLQLAGGARPTTWRPIPEDSFLRPTAVGGETVRFDDLLATDPADLPIPRLRQLGVIRSSLSVPLLRGGSPIGFIHLHRPEVRPFTDAETALVESFADQAVIAIENARLFSELQASNTTLKEALEQQTATADVLRVIASSPTDLQRALDEIAERAARLTDATGSGIWRVEGSAMRRIGWWRGEGDPREATGLGIVTQVSAGNGTGRAVVEARTVQVPDLDRAVEELGFSQGWVDFMRRLGVRSVLSTPLLRGGAAIGALTVRRVKPVPFTPAQAALLESFADQAVIAIENARLFSELQQSNTTLKEALEQQTATATVLRVIASSPADLQLVLDTVTESAGKLCGAEMGAVFRRQGDVFVRAGDFGATDAMRAALDAHPISIHDPSTVAGRAVSERRPVLIPDVLADPSYRYAPQGVIQYRTIVGVPLIRDDDVIGVFSLARRDVAPFTAEQMALVQTFADQAIIAIENARLFSELNDANATLKEALEQQTATADILRVISRSPADLDPVLDAIVSSAARLCGGANATLRLADGDQLRAAAHHGDVPLRRGATSPITPATLHGLAFLERRTIHVPDTWDIPDLPDRAAWYRSGGGRWSMLLAPLLREGTPMGVLNVRRTTPEPFTQQQIALLESFADQAVIAIENARLFQELNESNATLKEALEQQTATADILRVIAESTSDLPAVMRTILEQAVRLCGAADGSVRLIEGNEWVIIASVGDFIDRLKGRGLFPETRRPLPLHLSIGDAIRAQRSLYHRDTRQSDEPLMVELGILSQLYVPLPGEGTALGYLTIRATHTDAFSPSQIALVETFARQAAIAIRNTRLLQQLQGENDRKQHELERARTIQQRLLPTSVPQWPHKLEIAYRFRAAVETSGDFYDVVQATGTAPNQPGPLQIAVGDTAGKGLGAALVMSLARAGLRSAAQLPISLSPAGTARMVSDRLHADVGSSSFVACALATVEIEAEYSGPRLRLVNAGQVPVLLCRGGEAAELVPPGSRFPLGAVRGVAYQELVEDLLPGDVVILCTDGLPEAPASTASAVLAAPTAPPERVGDLLGFERLALVSRHWSACGAHAEDVAAGIWSDLTAWCGLESHHDDMTLLVLCVPGTTP